ncbi:MAG TPA: hypothetical protein VEQ37_13855 [Actinomycetota bacterium]|nr:hypothetical protein [Actinomycetota bacterium]
MRRTGAAFAFLAAAGLAEVLFLFYFLAYRARRYPMPVGFDASWYVWRARFVGAEGLGALGTSVRPGHALLASILSGLTGLSQLRLAVILPLVLVSVFALAVGAFWAAGVGNGLDGRLGHGTWIVAVSIAGTLVGASRLVGENVANLLMLAMVVAAVAAVARRIDGGRGWSGAVVLLVAAGLAHWIFLGVAMAVLGLTAILGMPVSVRRRREGVAWLSTESGIVASAVVVSSGVMGVLIAALLRAPFRTFEIKEDPRRYLPKFRTDLARLFLPGLLPVALVGGGGLARERNRRRHPEPYGFWLRVLVAWTAVSAIGMAYGALTLDLPPHRFLTLLVAVPGAIALTAAVGLIAGIIGRHAGRVVGAAVAGVAVAGLALPGALAWYRHGPGVWMDAAATRQAAIASAYVAHLPAGQPVVFLVDPHGSAGLISVPLKERVIRAALAPDQQTRAHFFAGEPSDLLAGRPSAVRSDRLERALQQYWKDVRTVLRVNPPVIVLNAYAKRQFEEVRDRLGATLPGPGVAVLRGPRFSPDLVAAPLRRPVPRTLVGALLGMAILAALFVAGAGWTRLLLGPEAPSVVVACSMPAVGCAVLMIGGLVAAKVGVRLGGIGGVATFAVIAAAGIASAGWEAASRRDAVPRGAPRGP